MVQLDEVWEMTDKELIEMAAKAYGFGDPEGNFVWTESEYPLGSKTSGALWNYMGWCDTAELWNPLTDDGDALRLAVKLGLSVERNRYCVQVSTMPTAEEYDNDERGALISSEPLGVGVLCPHKATRRAIVRAAAEIGKEM